MLDTPDLAAQLRQPHGDAALAVADSMNRSNGELNKAAIGLLAVLPGEHVLEIGPGNAAFAPLLLKAPGSRYLGIELSPEMVRAGNAKLADAGLAERAALQLGDANALALEDACVDAVLAVNISYFWPSLPPVLDELARVLRPGGRLCLAFGDPAFMRTLAFSAHGFHLYTREDFEHALHSTGQFARPAWHSHQETGISNDGRQVQKHFHILLAQRE